MMLLLCVHVTPALWELLTFALVAAMEAERRGIHGHVFAMLPDPPESVFDRVRTQGRFVVALLVAVVLGLAGVVIAIGMYFANSAVPAAVRTVGSGPVQVSLSLEMPSAEFIVIALLAMVAIAGSGAS